MKVFVSTQPIDVPLLFPVLVGQVFSVMLGLGQAMLSVLGLRANHNGNSGGFRAFRHSLQRS